MRTAPSATQVASVPKTADLIGTAAMFAVFAFQLFLLWLSERR